MRIRQKIGHKDIPYFIWKEGLPKCLRKDISTEADYKGYTKELVEWIWRTAEYIFLTKKEADIMPESLDVYTESLVLHSRGMLAPTATEYRLIST